MLPISVGLERRPRPICALVFRVRTEVYECYIYTRRDKTSYYNHILLSYHMMWGCHKKIQERVGGGGGLTVIEEKKEIYHKNHFP